MAVLLFWGEKWVVPLTGTLKKKKFWYTLLPWAFQMSIYSRLLYSVISNLLEWFVEELMEHVW